MEERQPWDEANARKAEEECRGSVLHDTREGLGVPPKARRRLAFLLWKLINPLHCVSASDEFFVTCSLSRKRESQLYRGRGVGSIEALLDLQTCAGNRQTCRPAV